MNELCTTQLGFHEHPKPFVAMLNRNVTIDGTHHPEGSFCPTMATSWGAFWRTPKSPTRPRLWFLSGGRVSLHVPTMESIHSLAPSAPRTSNAHRANKTRPLIEQCTLYSQRGHFLAHFRRKHPHLVPTMGMICCVLYLRPSSPPQTSPAQWWGVCHLLGLLSCAPSSNNSRSPQALRHLFEAALPPPGPLCLVTDVDGVSLRSLWLVIASTSGRTRYVHLRRRMVDSGGISLQGTPHADTGDAILRTVLVPAAT